MRTTIGRLRQLINEAISISPEAETALTDVLAVHPNRGDHELWFADDGHPIVDIPDDDSRSVERYEWNGDQWVHWDSEPYHD